MYDQPARFYGSIPEIYDRCLGPLLFEVPAQDLARRVAAHMPQRGILLEVACGTGVSTEFLYHILSKTVSILATDVNEKMLKFAEDNLADMTGVNFQIADAQDLPFVDKHFDAIACQFGFMFFSNKEKSLSEMMRVLKPGGKLIFNVWDTIDTNPVVGLAVKTIASFFTIDPPAYLEQPYAWCDIDMMKARLHGAGFTEVDVSMVKEIVKGLDANSVAEGLVTGNPGIIEIRDRANAEPAEIILELAEEITREFGPEKINIPLQELVFSATKPIS